MSEICVSIIVVNYNTKNLIDLCLESIYKYTTGISYEIIVVDNASIDGSVHMIENKYVDAIIIKCLVNNGFGRANNLGAKIARGKYILLLNSDVELLENTVKYLCDYYESHQDLNIGAIGGHMIGSDMLPKISCGNYPSIKQELFEYGLHKILIQYYNKYYNIGLIISDKKIRYVDYISGANMLIKKEIYEELNGFDEDFFLYYEETELCYRLTKNGYVIVSNPGTTLLHAEGGSSNSVDSSIQNEILRFRSKYLYYLKCHGRFKATLVKYLALPKIIIKNRKYVNSQLIQELLKIGHAEI